MSEDASFSNVSYQVGADWRVRTSLYADTTPIIGVDAGPSYFSVTTRGRVADQAAVEFARSLAFEARKFADEMERLHATQFADPGEGPKVAGSDAA